jgi:glucokinase
MDPNAGVVLNAPNLPGWINVPLRSRLQEAVGVPVRIGNDANLAALGEWRYGAGQGVNHLIYLAISTGIGGGVISDGRLIVGWRGLGVEPGHMPMVEDGPLCGCGKRGHLEALASGTAIARRAAELLGEGQPSSLLLHGSPVDAEAVSRAAESGDALGQRVLREAGEALGRALAGLVHIFNPQRIILGGGVARAGDIFWEPIRRTLQAEVMSPAFLEGVDLVPAALGDDAGLVGALVLATLP